MTNNVILAVLLAFCLLLSTNVSAENLEQWHWTTNFPQGFEVANQYPKHSTTFDSNKKYLFLKSGKIKDLFAEVGKPDGFSRQIFYSYKYSSGIKQGCSLCGTFLYKFNDGTTMYIRTGNMDAISLAMIYSKGKKAKLLYK